MNKIQYEKKHIVSSYPHAKLQSPEVMILVKYRENILDKHVLDIGCGAVRTMTTAKIGMVCIFSLVSGFTAKPRKMKTSGMENRISREEMTCRPVING